MTGTLDPDVFFSRDLGPYISGASHGQPGPGAASPLHAQLARVEAAHHAGQIDAGVQLKAIDRRITAAENRLWNAGTIA